jgi:TRAP-type C4-dicarboxylate transport system substrate-binding protein
MHKKSTTDLLTTSSSIRVTASPYDIFSAKLKQLSGGKMLVDQYPGAQLGQEPQLLQLVKSGDLDFAIVSSANTATISPQAGVMSLHFLFRDENHMVKALGDPKVFEAIRDMIDQTVQGIHVIGLGTQGSAEHVQQKGNPQN